MIVVVRAPGGMAVRLATFATTMLVAYMPAVAHARSPNPQTGFEARSGAAWTTLPEEQSFLAAIDGATDRVRVVQTGATVEGRPLQLAQVAVPVPPPPKQAAAGPVLLLICSQHGNEPAGREACLQSLRTLALTEDPQLIQMLREWTVLFVPTANPDGRAANIRRNGAGVDINRDHVTLESPEARMIAAVVRDWRPDVVLDLHEFYGPRRSHGPREINDSPHGGSVPVLNDEDVLYLWPRNLNVDSQVYGLSRSLALDYIGPGVRRAGYEADEYGIFTLGQQDLAQYAGGADPGIARNAFGLRHAISVLIESNAEPSLDGMDEIVSQKATNRRRVASQVQTILETLRFVRKRGAVVARATTKAAERKAAEGWKRSAAVYFGGADNEAPKPMDVQFPPPCGYQLSDDQMNGIASKLDLLGIGSKRRLATWYVPMGQAAEPLVAVVLDGRSQRHLVAGTAVDDICLRLIRRCVGEGRLRVELIGETGEVRDVNFKLDKRLVVRRTREPFRGTIAAQTLKRTSAKRLRAVAYVRDGTPFRLILSRTLPRCGR